MSRPTSSGGNSSRSNATGSAADASTERDDPSYDATDTDTGSNTSSEDTHGGGVFQMIGEYKRERRTALEWGSRDWAMGLVSIHGDLHPCHPDEMLDVRDQGFSLREIQELSEDLANDPDVRAIDLSGNLLGLMHEDGNPPPRPPDGHPYPMMPAVVALADCFRVNEALTRIDVSRNCLGDLGQPSLELLLSSIANKKKLVILDLSCNGIMGPEGDRYGSVAHLCRRVLPASRLIHLNLSYNELHAEFVRHMASCITKVPSLLVLDLSGNRISEDPRGGYCPAGLEVFCSQLQLNTTLTSLKVAENRLGNDECIQLAKTASAMMELRSLDLRDNYIHACGAAAIAESFFADEHLEVLELSGNPLTDAGGAHIADMLVHNTRIGFLSLARTGITTDVARAFDRALETNTKLTTLDVNDNSILTDHVKYFHDGPKSNKDLARIIREPRKYDLSAATHVVRRHLVNKIHHVPEEKMALLYNNPTFLKHKAMHLKLLELLPPTRKKILFTGALEKTTANSAIHRRAARTIQRRWRIKKGLVKKSLTMKEVAEMKQAQVKRELLKTYGAKSFAKEKMRRAAQKTKNSLALQKALGGGLAKIANGTGGARIAPEASGST